MFSAPLDNAKKVQFKPEAIIPLIDKLLTAKDLQSVSNQHEDAQTVYKMLHHPFIYCWITPHSIIGNSTKFKFKFNLYIDDYNYAFHDYQIQPRSVYKYEFKTSFKDIRSIYTKAMVQRKYFPVQKFPKLLPETLARRSAKLQEDLQILDQYTHLDDDLRSIDGNYICTGPGKKHWWSSSLKQADDFDIYTLSYILCKLFNSPAFCYVDDAFDNFMTECKIAKEMKQIIKFKGFMLLNTLRMKSLTFTVRDPANLHNELYLDERKKRMRFHTITVCARPVHGVKNVSLIDHWALKFEGDEYLLTLDYYANSKVIAIICKNTCVGQKIFWYSWCANSKQLFTSRWGTLSKIYLHKDMQSITGECIGHIITEWRSKHNKYCSMTNNCQHFVRDMLTIFEFNAAQFLSTKFHHRVVEGIIFPSLPFMDEIDEQKRMKEIRVLLEEEFKRYHKEIYVDNDDEKGFGMKYSENVSMEMKEFDGNIPDINEEGIECEQSRLRFKQWLCDEIGMDQYLDLFAKQDLDQIQWIQWFDADVLTESVGIKCKLHAMFIEEQAIGFDVDVIQDVNVYKHEFDVWLCEEVKLKEYLQLFQDKCMNDSRQIQFFEDHLLKDIGIQKEDDRELIVERAKTWLKLCKQRK